ncbi:hypothetical protein CES86_1952 [Brucella lupini]|uniref:Uncharacterized protein n=1 Tax=Brucella lupini TaxID=255457 RepID=A0A256GTY1_9HYPH|nr:hypothetical protein CES86_1952 [Brucella lupini]
MSDSHGFSLCSPEQKCRLVEAVPFAICVGEALRNHSYDDDWLEAYL